MQIFDVDLHQLVLKTDAINHLADLNYYNARGFQRLSNNYKHVLNVTAAMYLLHDLINNNPLYVGLLGTKVYYINDFESKEHLMSNTNTIAANTSQAITIHHIDAQRRTSNYSIAELPLENKAMTMALTMGTSHTVRVYKVTDDKWSIITTHLDSTFLLRVLALIPILLPRYDTPMLRELAGALVADDVTLFKSTCNKLLETQWEEYSKNAKIAKLYKQADEYTTHILHSHRTSQDSLRRQERELIGRLQDLYIAMADVDRKIFAITANDENNPLRQALDYIIPLKGVDITRIEYTNESCLLRISVCMTLFNWDVDAAETLINNTRYNVFDSAGEHIKKVFKNILVEQTAKLWFTNNITYNVTNGEVYASTDTDTIKGVPNPHLYYFNCWGSNKASIVQATRNNNIDVALAYIVSACRSWNMHDGTVMDKMLKRISDEIDEEYDEDDDDVNIYIDTPCITVEDTDGLMTLREYITYVSQEDEAQ